MMSGTLYWGSGGLSYRGTYGYFWASTPYAYTNSHFLYFHSTNVYPKDGYYKPYGLTLRCVARNSKNLHPCSTSIEFRRFPPRSKFWDFEDFFARGGARFDFYSRFWDVKIFGEKLKQRSICLAIMGLFTKRNDKFGFRNLFD